MLIFPPTLLFVRSKGKISNIHLNIYILHASSLFFCLKRPIE